MGGESTKLDWIEFPMKEYYEENKDDELIRRELKLLVIFKKV